MIIRNLAVAGPLMTCLVLPAPVPGETAIQAWVQTYNGLANLADHTTAVTVDHSNNVIVVGDSTGSGSSRDFTAIKYSSAGVPLWTNKYIGAGSASAVAVDSGDNVIVTGSSSVFLTIKYSSAGLPLWTNRYQGPGNGENTAYAVAVDSGDNVIVTGTSAGVVNGQDFATIKYSKDGVPLWTNRHNGGFDVAYAIAVDGNDNVIVAGFTGTNVQDFATIKYSNTGVPLWTNKYNGPGNNSDQARAVAVDSSNNVIVTGPAYDSSGLPYFATIKYSNAGVPLWTNLYKDPWNGSDTPSVVAIDGSDNVVISGMSLGSWLYATVKYSSAGVPLWTNLSTGGVSWPANAMVLDRSNNVIVTTYSWRGTDYYYETIKYSNAGVALWTNRCKGPGPSGGRTACAMALDHSGNIIIAGTFGTYFTYDWLIVKYSFPLVITNLRLTNGNIQVSGDNVRPRPLVMEASTDLAGWLGIFTNTAPTNGLFYTDPVAGSAAARFYRAWQSP